MQRFIVIGGGVAGHRAAIELSRCAPAATIDLVRRGVIDRDESVVVCVTGNGYKTAEVMQDRLLQPVNLGRAFKEFEAWMENRRAPAPAV